MADADLRAIFERYGYDPDDPVRGRDIPDRLLHALAAAPLIPPGMPLGRRVLRDAPLAARELETVELLACGRGYKEIAAIQVVTVETVKKRLKVIYRKLGARNAAHAVAIAIAQRLIPLQGANDDKAATAG